MSDDIHVYAGTAGHSAWFSDDAGATWVHPNSHSGMYLEARVWALASHAATPEALYAGTDMGVFRWNEAAARWTPLPSPLRDVWAIVQHPHQPQVLLAGTRPAALWRSDDGGETWSAPVAGLISADVHGLAIVLRPAGDLTSHAAKNGSRSRSSEDHAGNAILFATTNMGLHRNDDEGVTWRFCKLDSPWQYTRAIVPRADHSGCLCVPTSASCFAVPMAARRSRACRMSLAKCVRCIGVRCQPAHASKPTRSRSALRRDPHPAPLPALHPAPLPLLHRHPVTQPQSPAAMTPSLKIGLMVPINNTTMEGELTAWLPPGTQCKTLRIPRGKGLLTADSIPACKAQALELAKQIRAEGIDILAYGCTAASFIAGPAAEPVLTQDLMEAGGAPVATTARAMVQTLQDAKAQDIAVVTPYQDAVNAQIKLFLTDGGIRVRAFDSLYAKDVDALGRINADEVAAIARSTMNDDCDAMFIACSQLPTYAILDGLRADFRRPVLSSIQSTAWQVQRTLGL